MTDQANPLPPGKHGPGRVLVVSVAFPAVAFFFGSFIGLVAALLAVAAWWTTGRFERVLWPVAVGLLAAAPFATWAQGLLRTPVVGADFGVRHWLATDLVVAALTLASFAACTELLRVGSPRKPADRGDAGGASSETAAAAGGQATLQTGREGR